MAKPKTAAGYDETTTRYARATCLTVATKLGDLMDDLVVVGGLVPSLLIGRGEAAPVDPHVGTMDPGRRGGLRHAVTRSARPRRGSPVNPSTYGRETAAGGLPYQCSLVLAVNRLALAGTCARAVDLPRPLPSFPMRSRFADPLD